MIYIFKKKKKKLLQYCSKHRNEREMQLWACAPRSLASLQGLMKAWRQSPACQMLSLSLGSAALLGLSVTGSQAQKPTSAAG